MTRRRRTSPQPVTPLGSITDEQLPSRMIPDMGESRRVYREYPVSQIFAQVWTVEMAQAAVREHELGQFQRSAMMIDAMGQDDRIEGALDTLILGILRLPFKIARAKNATAKQEKAAEFIEALWSQAVPETELYELLRWTIMGGLGLGEIVWDTTEDAWKPIGLKVWHLQHVYWREDIRRLIVMTGDGSVEVDPGNGKWVLLAPGGMRAWMRGAVRTLWRWWLLRGYVARDWSHHSEVLGQGVMLARSPAEASQDNKDRFVSSLRSMGTDGIIETPRSGAGDGFSYDVDILEAQFDHGAGFEKLLLRCEANISIRLLGQNATSENEGPYVARGVFQKVTLDRIDGIVGPLEALMRDQICRPICDFNFGDASLAPTPDYDAEPPPDKLALANTLLNLGQFMSNASTAGYAIDPVQLTERFGIAITAYQPPFTPAELQTGFVTRNEARDRRGLEPRDDGDELMKSIVDVKAEAAEAKAEEPAPAKPAQKANGVAPS